MPDREQNIEARGGETIESGGQQEQAVKDKGPVKTLAQPL